MAVITLTIALIILAQETRSVFKSQLTIFQAQDMLRQFDKLKMDTLKNEVKDLKESIRLSDAGICMLYATLKEHTDKKDARKNKKS